MQSEINKYLAFAYFNKAIKQLLGLIVLSLFCFSLSAVAAENSGTVIKQSGRLLLPTATVAMGTSTLYVLPTYSNSAQFHLQGPENQQAVAQVQPQGGDITLSDGAGHTLRVYNFMYGDYDKAQNIKQIGSGSSAYALITYPLVDEQPIVLGVGGYIDIPANQTPGTYTGTGQLKICDGTSLNCSAAQEHVTSFDVYAVLLRANEVRKIKDMTFPPIFAPKTPLYGHLLKPDDPGAAVFAVSGTPSARAQAVVSPVPVILTRRGGAPGDPTITVTSFTFGGCNGCNPSISGLSGRFGFPRGTGATEIYLGGLEDIPANCPAGVYENSNVTFTIVST